jgi:hypothetical protein
MLVYPRIDLLVVWSIEDIECFFRAEGRLLSPEVSPAIYTQPEIPQLSIDTLQISMAISVCGKDRMDVLLPRNG